MKVLDLIDTPESKVWFTSDTHYNHQNICKGVSNWKDADDVTRNYKTLGDMNTDLIVGINTLIGPGDTIVHLGDWSFGGFESIAEFRKAIICPNVHLVLGNHDIHIARNRENIQSLFSSVSDMLEIRIKSAGAYKNDKKPEDYVVQACHYPMMSWKDMNKGAFHLHGHVHLPAHKVHAGEGRIMDVGVDGNGMMPVSFRRIISMLKDRPMYSSLPFKDHHVKRIS